MWVTPGSTHRVAPGYGAPAPRVIRRTDDRTTLTPLPSLLTHLTRSRHVRPAAEPGPGPPHEARYRALGRATHPRSQRDPAGDDAGERSRRPGGRERLGPLLPSGRRGRP